MVEAPRNLGEPGKVRMDTLDEIIEYTPASTLREVVGSALTGIDRTWEDVRGIAVLLQNFELPDELHDRQTGLVHAERIDEALGFDVTDNADGFEWPWGGYQGDLYRQFEMTVWLEDCVLKFEERYAAGSYIECRRIPSNPPPAYSYAAGKKGFEVP
jgi:hypothetical protein